MDGFSYKDETLKPIKVRWWFSKQFIPFLQSCRHNLMHLQQTTFGNIAIKGHYCLLRDFSPFDKSLPEALFHARIILFRDFQISFLDLWKVICYRFVVCRKGFKCLKENFKRKEKLFADVQCLFSFISNNYLSSRSLSYNVWNSW